MEQVTIGKLTISDEKNRTKTESPMCNICLFKDICLNLCLLVRMQDKIQNNMENFDKLLINVNEQEKKQPETSSNLLQ